MKADWLHNINLTLFFTAGVGLKNWDETGSIDRELEFYKRLKPSFNNINLVTYGGKSDRVYIDKLDGLNLLAVSWHSRQQITAIHLALRFFPQLLRSDILKTNQIRGAQIPVWLKKVFRKKLIVRCGFLHSFLTSKETDDSRRIDEAARLERTAFQEADLGIVTSSWQRDIVIKNYGVSPVKVKVIPNYVLTDLFRPIDSVNKKYDLIFVGRGGAVKNLPNLLGALRFLKLKNKDVSLLMMGGCSDNQQLIEIAESDRLNVTFKANVPNAELPGLLNQARAFILPSLCEGHPKALIEAMSCALACIGTDVIGIRDNIEHLKTGYLCETESESLANAIIEVLNNSKLREMMGVNARNHVKQNFDIEHVLKLELEAIQELLSA